MTTNNALDVLVLLALFLIVMLVAVIFTPRGFLAWVREEWRLARLDTWDDGKADAPRACTVNDPGVRRMVAKQRAFGERLRRDGRSLLAGRHYTPALTKPTEAPPPRADKVVPIHRAKGATR